MSATLCIRLTGDSCATFVLPRRRRLVTICRAYALELEHLTSWDDDAVLTELVQDADVKDSDEGSLVGVVHTLSGEVSSPLATRGTACSKLTVVPGGLISS